MPKPIALAAILVLVSALAVVDLRHRNRTLFVQLQTLHSERDALNIEWDQLLLEQGAWSEHRRVESVARTRLGMGMPENIVIVRAPGAKTE